MQRRTSPHLLRLTRAALIAALYVALTYLSALLGISSGVIQFRLSEMLCILPVIMPEAVIGLYLGCMLSNLLTGCVLWDVIFGSLATLLGALGAYALRRMPPPLGWIATLPTVLANMLIIPPVLSYAYGATDSFWYMMLTVGIGEIVCATGGGSLLYYLTSRGDVLKKINSL